MIWPWWISTPLPPVFMNLLSTQFIGYLPWIMSNKVLVNERWHNNICQILAKPQLIREDITYVMSSLIGSDISKIWSYAMPCLLPTFLDQLQTRAAAFPVCHEDSVTIILIDYLYIIFQGRIISICGIHQRQWLQNYWVCNYDNWLLKLRVLYCHMSTMASQIMATRLIFKSFFMLKSEKT